jgi:hypothetical protein
MQYQLRSLFNIESHRKNIFLASLLSALAGVAFMTIALQGYVNAASTSDNNNNTNITNVLTPNELLLVDQYLLITH